MGKFTFEGCNFNGNEVGIQAPESAEMSFKKTSFERNGEAILIYENKGSFIEQNFNPGVPLENLEQAAHQLKTSDPSEYPSILEKFGINKWLKPAVDISTIAANIATLFGR
ncbi:TPA: hypothetical protein ACLE2D_003738 [Citrobacter freundii]